MTKTTDHAETLLDDLRDGVADLLDSDRWAAYLRFAASFHDYSPRNRLLIWIQRPDATRCAGYRAWQALGRQVRKGETGIKILAPMTRTITDEKTDEKRRIIVGWRQTSTFAIEQTDPTDEWDDPSVATLLDGIAPEGAAERLIAAIRAAGFGVTFERHQSCEAANGVTDWTTRTVSIAPDLDPAQQAKTLAHELAHVLLHDPESDDRPTDRSVIEVEAESVAYVVTRRLGLDSSGYSLGYVATWGGGDDAIDTLSAVADRVVRAADEISETLDAMNVTVVA